MKVKRGYAFIITWFEKKTEGDLSVLLVSGHIALFWGRNNIVPSGIGVLLDRGEMLNFPDDVSRLASC
jgi:hypothetical protein